MSAVCLTCGAPAYSTCECCGRSFCGDCGDDTTDHDLQRCVEGPQEPTREDYE